MPYYVITRRSDSGRNSEVSIVTSVLLRMATPGLNYAHFMKSPSLRTYFFPNEDVKLKPSTVYAQAIRDQQDTPPQTYSSCCVL